jgi:hypothetical protein
VDAMGHGCVRRRVLAGTGFPDHECDVGCGIGETVQTGVAVFGRDQIKKVLSIAFK